MAKILIPTPLRQFADKHDAVEFQGTTVGEVLSSLAAQYPDLGKQIFNDQGKLRSFVNVYLNDEDIRYLKKDATPVEGTDRRRNRHALDRSQHCRRQHQHCRAACYHSF
jgi:molybdopterin converting factor small subunit